MKEPVKSQSCGYLSCFSNNGFLFLYISPIYHTASLLPNPSPCKSAIDPRHYNDKCSLFSMIKFNN